MDGDTTYRFLSFAGERHAISSYQTTFVQIHCEEKDKAVPPTDNELHCVSQAIGMIAGTRVIKAHGALSVVLSEPLHSNQQESQS